MRIRKVPLKMPISNSEQSKRFIQILNQNKLNDDFLKQCSDSASLFEKRFYSSTQTK